ncbi:DUF881 domain-containing protein [Luteococcus peritonei]|uniref:DUF881 domain-containing protein n=1 Tax=Luteococcus peritonei TaxID=88874 RepID=A0ABW4RWP6_9ACTN
MDEPRSLRARVGGVLGRARRLQRAKPVPTVGRLASFLVVVSAGVMLAVSANVSSGTDLRPDREQDLADLVRSQAARNKQLSAEVDGLRREVDQASAAEGEQADRGALDRAAARAGLSPVQGPAVRVTLTDAPLSVQPAGVDGDLLVVHQQDIQMVVNVLWAAGAEAMTIQGQRVTSQTGIKCVGNTVVLHGVPYAPPYVITAIGDQRRLEAALADSPEVAVYREYVQAYRLGWKQESPGRVTMPGFTGSLDLAHARVPGS